jgi:hypothetical protein
MTPWQRVLTLGLVAFVTTSLVAGKGLRAQSSDSLSLARRAHELTTRLDLDFAKRELEGADPDLADVVVAKGRLGIYTGDCDEAAALLGRRELAVDEDARALADVARGCARVTAALVVRKDEARAIEVKFQDEHDAALFPLLVETIEKARTMLSADLGVDWPKPTRFVVVRDHLSLSAMTGLPYESARTTGTVAVAKWGKVTLLSPRAAHHGYAWRDTVTHELTHLAITRASADRAPLWLQEGLAKREEVRWRAPSAFDDRPSPEAVVLRGIEKKLDLPLDKLGPSIAMLPSAEAAMVAFSEVTSFVRYFADHSERDALPRLLGALKSGQTVDDALKSVSGKDLPAWDVEWRAYLAKRPKEPLSAAYGLGAPPKNLREARERIRLAELLLAEGHPREALREMSTVTDELLADPSVRALRGRALEAQNRHEEAFPLVADPKDVMASHAPWWALRGRALFGRGDLPGANAAFLEGLGEDPFNAEVSCRSAPSDASSAAFVADAGGGAPDPGLCAAAKRNASAYAAD